MKRTKILICAVLPLLVFQSCLFEDEELFEQSASERVGDLASQTEATLLSNPTGWVMEYFPSLSYGGYNFVIGFADGKATISCETAAADYTEECLYDVIKEDGAVLTFNTYCSLLHQFHEPSSTSVGGKRGDYEFRVISVSSEHIELQGKLNERRINMYPLPEGHTAESYLSAIKTMQKSWDGDYGIYSTDNQRIATSIGNRGGRQLSVTVADKTTSQPTTTNYAIIYGLDGIRFYNQVNIGGYYGTRFKVIDDELVAVDGDLKLCHTLERRLRYNEILGNWTLHAEYTTDPTIKPMEFQVLFEKDIEGRLFNIVGLGDFVLNAQYESGKIFINPQFVGTYEGKYIWLILYDMKRGYAFWDTSYSIRGLYSVDSDQEYFTLGDCGSADDYTLDNMLMYAFSTPDATSGSMVTAFQFFLNTYFYR